MPTSRIQSVSRRFAALSVAPTVLLPLVTVAYRALMPADLLAGQRAGKPDAIAAMSWTKRLAAMGATALGLLPLGWCLAALHRLFRLYAGGTIFGAENVAALNGIGMGLFWFGAVQLLAPTAIPLILTFDNPAGERLLVLSLGSGAIEAIVLGGVVRLIGWVMDEARAIAEEQLLTV